MTSTDRDHGSGPAAAVDRDADPGATDVDGGARTGESPGEPAGDRTIDDGAAERAAGRHWHPALVVSVLTAVVVVPLGVALVALRSPRWYPLLDLAMTELRVRDVGSRHTPLIGLVGRLSSNGNQGSHPGPISFWALAPVYRLLGGTSWSLMVGVVVLNTTAVALTLWVALRRGGAALALGFAAAIAVLVHLYGTQVLTEPWNPYMPVMWWPLTLVAVWAVLDGDLPMLPVAVFAGSFCMQTHISYIGIVAGIAALSVAGLAVRAHRLRGDRPARRRLAMWAGLSLALAVVLWLPPIIDQVINDPGNASVVVDHFLDAEDEPIGASRGLELFAVHLDPWRLVTGHEGLVGSVVPGLVLVGAWLASVLATWRLAPVQATAGADGQDGDASSAGESPGGHDPRALLLRLHVVVAAALVLGLVSAVRILGFVWHYLLLWAWGTTAVTMVAIVWTAVLVARRRGGTPARLAARGGTALAAGVVVVWTVVFAAQSRDAQPTQHRVSEAVGELMDPLLVAIDEGQVAQQGRDASYRVTWTDGTYIGSPGYALFSELERRGLDVGVAEPQGPGAQAHRVLPAAEADAEVHVSVGPDIELWQSRSDAVMIAYVDPRTDEERARFAQARRDSIEQLQALGRDDLVELVDLAPFMLFLNDSLPDETRATIAPLGDIGQPLAVFVTTTVG